MSMTTKQITDLCKEKEQELLDKYFGNLIHEAAIERPETVDNVMLWVIVCRQHGRG